MSMQILINTVIYTNTRQDKHVQRIQILDVGYYQTRIIKDGSEKLLVGLVSKMDMNYTNEQLTIRK